MMRLAELAGQTSRKRKTGSSLARRERRVNDGEVERWRGSRDRGVARPEAGECAHVERGEGMRQEKVVMAQKCSADAESRRAEADGEECYGQGWRDVVSSSAIVSHPCRQRGGVGRRSVGSDQADWSAGVSCRPKLYATMHPLAARVQGLGEECQERGRGRW
ncbi:hypothetical protein IQ06DRAFT_93204 [Phaeosphaeriaceae sp. SRC1lsM3a]|nr:hypothetical protein IQ06DRAFT_93204 [Stagonospora sp. SRC1lsM3a]